MTTVIGPVGPEIWLGVPPKMAAKKPPIEITVETKPCRGVVSAVGRWKTQGGDDWECTLKFDPEAGRDCVLGNQSGFRKFYIPPEHLIAFADVLRALGHKSSKEI